MGKTTTIGDGYRSDLDEDYNPPKWPRPEPESPGKLYDSDGNEIEDDTEHGVELVHL